MANPNLVLFVDGSYCKNEKGNFKTSYSVNTQYELHEKGNLPQAKSDQKTIYALSRACQLLERQTVNIYTDSQYASGVIYDLGML